MADTLRITILRDGTIKTVSDEVSADNHDAAESFLLGVATLAGGETTREQRADKPVHEHTHVHADGSRHTHSH
jgi:hypothetical protein